jgi:hypothetical protein
MSFLKRLSCRWHMLSQYVIVGRVELPPSVMFLLSHRVWVGTRGEQPLNLPPTAMVRDNIDDFEQLGVRRCIAHQALLKQALKLAMGYERVIGGRLAESRQ